MFKNSAYFKWNMSEWINPVIPYYNADSYGCSWNIANYFSLCLGDKN
jgi:hypothetical protein